MSEATCAVLSAVFPLVLVTVAVERRNFAARLRDHKRLGQFSEYAVSFAFIGLILVVVGVQTNGLSDGWAFFAWLAFAVSMLGLLFSIIGAFVSAGSDTSGDPIE